MDVASNRIASVAEEEARMPTGVRFKDESHANAAQRS